MSRAMLFPISLFVLLLMSLCVFTVREEQQALVLNLGKIERFNVKPGLHFRIPIVHEVRRFDGRVLSHEIPQERFLTSEKKHVLVDAVIRWQISDTRQYFQATRGDESSTNSRIAQLVKERLRDEFNQRTLKQVVASERDNMIAGLQNTTAEVAKSLGIRVVDVRIKRIDLPTEVSGSVFDRMSSERKQVAEALRASGEKQAETIRATGEKEAKILIAEAEAKAQMIRGEGDAKAAEIYAKAYGSDAEFYSFFRSLQAYRKSFNNNGNVLVLDPNSDFFKYFEQQRP